MPVARRKAKEKARKKARMQAKKAAMRGRIRKMPSDIFVHIESDATNGEILAVYIQIFDGAVAKTVEYQPGLNIDLDRRGQLLGVEMLQPAKVSIKLIAEVAVKYNTPALKAINPKALVEAA